MTSYILYKSEILWLMRQTGYESREVKRLFEADAPKVSHETANRLADKGIININGGKISIERTIALLMYQLSKADKGIAADDGSYIFKCPKMYIIMSPDIHNSEKRRIIPVQNREQVMEYLNEHDIKVTEGIL